MEYVSDEESDSCLSKATSERNHFWVPLVREARSWWVFAKTLVAAKAKAKAKSGAKGQIAMVSRHTTYWKVHEPPTGVSRHSSFLLKRMVNHDDFEGQKPV